MHSEFWVLVPDSECLIEKQEKRYRKNLFSRTETGGESGTESGTESGQKTYQQFFIKKSLQIRLITKIVIAALASTLLTAACLIVVYYLKYQTVVVYQR